jgi:hypothetical protein
MIISFLAELYKPIRILWWAFYIFLLPPQAYQKHPNVTLVVTGIQVPPLSSQASLSSTENVCPQVEVGTTTPVSL